jgi:hypothetical protein
MPRAGHNGTAAGSLPYASDAILEGRRLPTRTKGTMPLDIIAPRMNELRGERDQIADELRQIAEAPDVIALRPTALEQACRDRFDRRAGNRQGIGGQPSPGIRCEPCYCIRCHRDRTAEHRRIRS